ncbi:glycosyltransferase family 2 protein [Streptomyces lavendulae]|uniref:glycosyltransferase family 2 protein n=1 Tax=Streptomyces lavendulae TaxID=1914 RepID=UPI0037216558
MQTFFTPAVVYIAMFLLCSVGIVILRFRADDSFRSAIDIGAVPVVFSCSLFAQLVCVGSGPVLLWVLFGGVTCVVLVRTWLAWVHWAGALLSVAVSQGVIGWAVWALSLTFDSHYSVATRALLSIITGMLLLGLPATLSSAFLEWEVLCRDSWSRPHVPHSPNCRDGPKVSVHLACYNEPPEVVIASLDALSRMDYEPFEVIVVDNNTKDPQLWRPVEGHCRKLGSKFRFFHVVPLSGAKAGALNFALTKMSGDSEIVAVVDADNQVTPDFLARLVGHFDDPRLGFIQTWYDFRAWSHSSFMAGCFWEYRFGYPLALRSLNERSAVFPMGTVCLFRSKALWSVGGWAEWCVTEDSELGIRLAAAGYDSLLINETFGYGLIPETFADYKKQRYRWTFGPAQAMRRHWRLFLPLPWASDSLLTPAQKMRAILPFFSQLRMASSLFTPFLAVTALFVILVNHEQRNIASFVWLGALISYAAWQLLNWRVCRDVVGCSPVETLLMKIMSMSLAHTIMVASFHGFIRRSTEWRHTRKFPRTARSSRILESSRNELFLGSGFLLAASLCFTIRHDGLVLVLELWLGLRGAQYLAAPVAAVLAERGIQARPTSPMSAGISK